MDEELPITSIEGVQISTDSMRYLLEVDTKKKNKKGAIIKDGYDYDVKDFFQAFLNKHSALANKERENEIIDAELLFMLTQLYTIKKGKQFGLNDMANVINTMKTSFDLISRAKKGTERRLLNTSISVSEMHNRQQEEMERKSGFFSRLFLRR